MTIIRYKRCGDTDRDVSGEAFMVEIAGKEYAAVMDGMTDDQLKVGQGWYDRGELDKLVSYLLLVHMGSLSAKEVLACCSNNLSEGTPGQHE